MNKFTNKESFISKLNDGMSIMVGGFMCIGTPENLIDYIVESKVKDLTIICNDAGLPGKGVGKLIGNGQVKRLVASHIGLNPMAGELMSKEEMIVDLIPQGTLAERIRCGGAGLGGFLTPTGLGTMVEEGKEIITVNGKEYLLEMPIKADLSILYGTTVDEYGNTLFTKTTRNFNPVMATASDLVVVQAREVIKEMNPDHVMTPHIFVDMIIKEEN